MLSRLRWCSWLLGVLFVSVALLQPCSGDHCDSGSAEAADDDMITLVLPSYRNPRPGIFFTVPRVQEIEIIVTNNSIDLPVNTPGCVRVEQRSCFIRAGPTSERVAISFVDSKQSVFQKLTLTIDDTIEVWCRNYTFWNYTEGQNFNFSCKPVFTGMNVPTTDQYSIEWRRFYNGDDLANFKMDRAGFNENIVNNSTSNIMVTDYECVRGGYLFINNASRIDVGYYIPSVVMDSGSTLMPANETIIYYRTAITNEDEYEFSISVTFGTGSARDISIFCRVDAFPAPFVSWRLKDNSNSEGLELLPENDTHITFGEVVSVESPNNMGPNISYEAKLTIDDADYADAGIYHCVADSQVVVVDADIVRLRVKGPLRPLWPALGTIGVFILVAIIIAVGTLFDKLWESASENRDKTGGHHKRLFSVTSATEPETLNSSTTPQRSSYVEPTHHPVHRVPSSKVQLLDESSTTL